jgi:hypothetical protein
LTENGSTPLALGKRGAISCHGHRRPRLFRKATLAESNEEVVNAQDQAHFLSENILGG